MSTTKPFAGPCALAIALALSACTAAPERSGSPSGSGGKVDEISDQLHGGGTPGFFFLPPMVASPSYAGAFSTGLSPTVRIEEQLGDWGGSTVAIFTRTTGPDGVTVVEQDDHYQVNWHTDRFRLDPSRTYRIRVLVGDFELGYADVDVVSSGAQLRNVNTAEYIPLLDDRTLPIKFRIEPAALVCVGVTCTAADSCHEAGTCNRQTGTCTTPVKGDGAACPAAGECGLPGSCRSGTCVSYPVPDGTPCTQGVCGAGACRVGPDVSVRFSGPASTVAGAPFVLAYTVENAGPEPATAVTTRLVLPTSLRQFDFDPSGVGRMVSTFPFTYEFDHGTLAAGERRVVSITATQMTVGDATFTVGATTSAIDRDPANDQASATVHVAPAHADLRVEVRDVSETQPHLVGSVIRHRILLFNDGPEMIPGFSVVDEIPAGMELEAATPVGSYTICNYNDPDHPYCIAGRSSCSWTRGSRRVECTGDVIQPGWVEAVDVLMRSTASGNYVNTADVTPSGTIDPNAGNNTASLATPVLATADLSVEVSAPGNVIVGDAYDLVATVTNHGPDVVTGATATVGPLPTNVQLVSTSPACSGTGTLSCGLGNLAPGEARILTVSVRGVTVGNATTTIHVASNEADPFPANDSITRTTAVSAVPLPTGCDVSMSAEGSTATTAGGQFTVRFTVANAGPEAALGTHVRIVWPAGFQANALDSPGAACAWVWGGETYSLDCDYGTLDGSSSQVLTLSGYTNNPGDATFTASASTATTDRNSANDAAESHVVVAPARADVRVELRMLTESPYAAGQAIMYLVLVFNDGPEALPGYSFVDTLPAGLTLEYASPAAQGVWCDYGDQRHPYCQGRGVFGGWMSCRWNAGEQSASCSGGSIRSGGVEGFYIGARPTASGEYVNTVHVDAVSVDDPNPGNETGSMAITVGP